MGNCCDDPYYQGGAGYGGFGHAGAYPVDGGYTDAAGYQTGGYGGYGGYGTTVDAVGVPAGYTQTTTTYL